MASPSGASCSPATSPSIAGDILIIDKKISIINRRSASEDDADHRQSRCDAGAAEAEARRAIRRRRHLARQSLDPEERTRTRGTVLDARRAVPRAELSAR